MLQQTVQVVVAAMDVAQKGLVEAVVSSETPAVAPIPMAVAPVANQNQGIPPAAAQNPTVVAATAHPQPDVAQMVAANVVVAQSAATQLPVQNPVVAQGVALQQQPVVSGIQAKGLDQRPSKKKKTTRRRVLGARSWGILLMTAQLLSVTYVSPSTMQLQIVTFFKLRNQLQLCMAMLMKLSLF